MKTQEASFEGAFGKEVTSEFVVLTEQPVSRKEADALGGGALTARLHGFDGRNQPLLTNLPGLAAEVVARSTVKLVHGHIGCTVVVLLEAGDVRRPIIVGVLQEQNVSGEMSNAAQSGIEELEDGRLLLSAEHEIVLRCGAATITLTKAGKVVIHGTYISSRSLGVNRIKGGSVQIN